MGRLLSRFRWSADERLPLRLCGRFRLPPPWLLQSLYCWECRFPVFKLLPSNFHVDGARPSFGGETARAACIRLSNTVKAVSVESTCGDKCSQRGKPSIQQ